MTDDEIHRVAREAGINCDMAPPSDPDEPDTWYGNQYLPHGALRKFALAVEEALIAKSRASREALPACELCNGSGQLDGHPCDWCMGSGREAIDTHPPCAGKNCGRTSYDQPHSSECIAEHAAACAPRPRE